MRKFLVMKILMIILSNNIFSQWEACNVFHTFPLKAFASQGEVIYAATLDGGIYASTDNGFSWIAKNNGLTSLYVKAIAISGNNIFIGTGDYHAESEGVFFLSTDNGNTWINKSLGLPQTEVTAIAVSGDIIFVGTPNGIFISYDKGDNWINSNSGMGDNKSIVSIAISDQYIFVAVDDSYERGILLSTDNGNNWKEIKLNITPKIITFLSFNGNDLYLGTIEGLFLTKNFGDNWEKISPSIYINAMCFCKNRIILATYGKGIYLTDDNGKSWNNIGLLNINITSVTLFRNKIFGGTHQKGLYHSLDDGNTWEFLGISNPDIYSMLVLS